MSRKKPKYGTKASTILMVMRRYRSEHIRNDREVNLSHTYTSTINNIIKGLGEFTPENVERNLAQYVDDRRAGRIGIKPAADGTIYKELMCLQAALNWCYDRNHLDEKIVKRYEFKLIVKPSAPRPFYLMKAETYKLLDTALYFNAPVPEVEKIRAMPDKIPRLYIFIMIGLDTAARYATIKNLKWDQIDFENKKVRLLPKNTNHQTSKRRPTIALSERLYQLLKVVRAKNPDDIYVLGHNGSVRKSFAKAVARAGLPDTTTPHTLRHTFATLSLQKGVPAFMVAQVMGDNLQTVLKTYGHHCVNYTAEAVNSMA